MRVGIAHALEAFPFPAFQRGVGRGDPEVAVPAPVVLGEEDGERRQGRSAIREFKEFLAVTETAGMEVLLFVEIDDEVVLPHGFPLSVLWPIAGRPERGRRIRA